MGSGTTKLWNTFYQEWNWTYPAQCKQLNSQVPRRITCIKLCSQIRAYQQKEDPEYALSSFVSCEFLAYNFSNGCDIDAELHVYALGSH